ncbi:MAG: peptidoglycan editing factor PgeF [Ignavibacteriales bacterium]|nr:peptidoglycan editing factor PgeF [Ignavibacteriales bacterium]
MNEVEEYTALTSEKLSSFQQVKFGFSYRNGGGTSSPFRFNLSFSVEDQEKNVRRNRETFFGSLGIGMARLAFARQCHSNVTKVVEKPGVYESCDALVTPLKNIFLTVTVADCVPVFVVDPVRNVVAAVHAGWRGSAKGIVTETIQSMVSEFGITAKDSFAFVGPSAGSCCYQVADDVAREFSPLFVEKRGEKLFLDLKKVNTTQMSEAGIPMENVEVSSYCTICNPDLFHSYRRDQERSGRMMGVIGLV